ncbi:hypothetical protein [Phenylobacterium sp.]|uniref:hypothetical protein n=1 Tax=Phenylobacterium sp. TaxID=1871053 RepID=UPI002730AF74|nr:hypothetical protein [Phenylobacterium sp.]MDP1618823.1 hypothetical protein [Phenylobacterium sp.]
MIRVLAVSALGMAFGAFLAWPLFDWPLRPGWVGAVVLLLVAVAVRRHWDGMRHRDGGEPGPRERCSWHALAALALVSGHLIASLAQGVDLHVGQGNTLALDNWTLIAAAGIGWVIVRPERMEQDERDREMATRGVHVGYTTFIVLLIGLLLTLGFAPPVVVERLSPFVLGNVLVVVILLASLARHGTQLIGYRDAARPEDEVHG